MGADTTSATGAATSSSADDTALTELAPGIHLWRAVHPDWNAEVERVGSYALRLDAGVAIVDPLLPSGDADRAAVLDAIAQLAGDDPVVVLSTLPYHVRDSEVIAERFAAPIVGHPGLAAKLQRSELFVDATAVDAVLPFGVVAHRVGEPRDDETPFYVPELRVLAFGDMIVGAGNGELRAWYDEEDGAVADFRAEYVPGIEALLDHDVEHVLVTHGEPVVGGGRAALDRALHEHDPEPRLLPLLTGPALLES